MVDRLQVIKSQPNYLSGASYFIKTNNNIPNRSMITPVDVKTTLSLFSDSVSSDHGLFTLTKEVRKLPTPIPTKKVSEGKIQTSIFNPISD